MLSSQLKSCKLLVVLYWWIIHQLFLLIIFKVKCVAASSGNSNILNRTLVTMTRPPEDMAGFCYCELSVFWDVTQHCCSECHSQVIQAHSKDTEGTRRQNCLWANSSKKELWKKKTTLFKNPMLSVTWGLWNSVKGWALSGATISHWQPPPFPISEPFFRVAYWCTFNKETLDSSKTMATFYQSTWNHIPEEGHCHGPRNVDRWT